jgi:malonyl-CoA O-methyltransferase
MRLSTAVSAPDDFALEPLDVARSFDRAARSYDVASVLQTRVRTELLARLDLVRLEPESVLDLGCGTGGGAVALARRYRRGHVLALDLSAAMLRQAQRRRRPWRRFAALCADAARLPLAAGSVDLVFSNLMLQWCGDPEVVFRECARVLRPGGVLTFTSFGPDTLKELRLAWASADGYTHVNRFIDMHDLGDALVRAGLAEPVMDVERYTLTYADVRALMRDLKAIGAHNVNAGRPRGLTGRRALERVTSAYERERRDGRLPATYEVVYGQAWAPVGGPRSPVTPGETRIPIGRIGRRGPSRQS